MEKYTVEWHYDDVDFTLILSNPPYHTDFSVAKAFIEGSYKHLQMGGWLVMVAKRFDWYKNKIHAVFGGVRWIESGVVLTGKL